jgi:hypothetical protein
MVKRLGLGAVAMLGLFFSPGAGAQMRGGGGAIQMSPARQAAPMRMGSPARTPTMFASGMQLNRHASVIQVFPNQPITPNGVFLPSSTLIADQVSVPGLGFDYAHLAAVSGNVRFNTPSFRGGRHFRDSGFITPVFLGGYGYPYYSDEADYPPPQQQQPQVIVIQQPVPMSVMQQVAPAASVDSNNNGAAAPPSSVAPAPVREVGEFVLVRRDGKILFASMYTIVGSDLRYVTPEGIRRTVPMAELDAEATRAMNEARGTTLQF